MTIAHGDLRYDNLFFSDSGEMAVADWQIILRARGPYDVGLLPEPEREPAGPQGHARWTSFAATTRNCWSTASRATASISASTTTALTAMFCLVYPVISGGNLDLANERGVELVTAMLDRSIATILDLDCDEMIPA